MAFEKEKLFYSRHRAGWLPRHETELVVIKDEKLIGFFPSVEDAYEEAVRRLGDGRFLIVRVTGNGNGYLAV